MADEQQAQLSDREHEILRLVATGATNQQIANDLSISINTVKVHVRNIFGKIGVASRTEATLYALNKGLVTVPGGVAAPEPPAVAPVPPVVEDQPLPVVVPVPPVAPELPGGKPQPPEPVPFSSPVERPSATRWLVPVMIALVAALAGAGGAFALLRGNTPAALPTATAGPALPSSQISEAPDLTERWSTRAALPAAQTGAAAVSLGGKIYVVGGVSDDEPAATVWSYDPEGDTWQKMQPKPTPVRDVQAAVLNGKIYVPGGVDGDGKTLARVEVYDPATGWEQTTDLPAPRSAYSLAVLEGRIYLFGGLAEGVEQATVYVYEPGTANWQTLTPMPTARAYSGAVALDGRIFVMGGEAGGRVLSAIEEYSPAGEGREPWAARTPMPTERSRFGTGVIAGSIYLFGGTSSRPLVAYDIRADSWRTLSSEISPGIQPAVASRDASLFILVSAPARPLADLFEFQQIFTVRLPLAR